MARVPAHGTDLTPVPDRRPRTAAAIAAVLLFAGVGTVLALTTPWTPLPGAPHVEPAPSLDYTADQIARSRAFDAALNPPAYLSLAVGLAVVLVLGLTPLGARFLGWATRPVRRLPPRAALAAVALTTLLTLVRLPLRAWGSKVQRDYGLTTQSWGAWLVDQGRSLAVTWVMWAVVFMLLYWLLRRFPRYWWAGAATGGFVLVVAASFAYPVVVEPVFNSFRPLPAGELRDDLLAMARRDGVPVRDVLVADASRRTTTLNAYVSGFGSTRRIVVYDTLLQSPPDRVESIVAHELGHAKRGDVLYGTLLGALGVAGAMCLLGLVLGSPRPLRRAGVERAADPRSAALVLACVTVALQVSAPVQNVVSRRIEARADAHALDLTRDPDTFVAMQRELSGRNLSDLSPDALERLLFMTHPSGPERVAMARAWARLHQRPEPPPLTG